MIPNWFQKLQNIYKYLFNLRKILKQLSILPFGVLWSDFIIKMGEIKLIPSFLSLKLMKYYAQLKW